MTLLERAETTDAGVLPDETVHRVGAHVFAGTGCTGCGATYWACTDAAHTPRGTDGCCTGCRDASGHTVRPLEQVTGLLAEAAASGAATERAWVADWVNATMNRLPTYRTPDAHSKAELLITLRGQLDRRTATQGPRQDQT